MMAGRGQVRLGLDRLRRRIPSHWLLAKVGFVRHVTRDGGIVPEDCILDHRLARLYRLEEIVQVWTHIVPVMAAIHGVFPHGFFSELRIMFRVPLLEVFVPQLCGKCICVVTRVQIDSSLRRVAKIEFASIENSGVSVPSPRRT